MTPLSRPARALAAAAVAAGLALSASAPAVAAPYASSTPSAVSKTSATQTPAVSEQHAILDTPGGTGFSGTIRLYNAGGPKKVDLYLRVVTPDGRTVGAQVLRGVVVKAGVIAKDGKLLTKPAPVGAKAKFGLAVVPAGSKAAPKYSYTTFLVNKNA